jgi:hypothetical protein
MRSKSFSTNTSACTARKMSSRALLQKIVKAFLKGTVALYFPTLAFLINRHFLGSCLIYYIFSISVSNSPNYTFVSETPRNIFPGNTVHLHQHQTKVIL